MKLHRRTLEALEELRTSRWFCAVGQLVNDSGVERASSWEEAMLHCDSPGWDEASLEGINRCSVAVFNASRERHQMWNEIANELRRELSPLVKAQTLPVVEEHNLPEMFVNDVSGSLIAYLLEREYEDLYPPGLFSAVGGWYLRGHYPCGWTGKFPRGALVIY